MSTPNVSSVAVADEAATPRSNPFRSLNLSARFWVALGLVVLVLVLGGAGYLYPTSPSEKVGSLYDAPGGGLVLGTDNFGHDVLAVLMAGTRTSLVIGLLAGVIATTIGVTIGLVAGYVGGWVEELLMGFTNVVLAIPSIIVLILISISLPKSNMWSLAVVIGITAWPWTARAVRAQASSVATREHIDVARLSGARLTGILVRDVLPYILSYAVMAFVLQVSGAILAEAALSMLGLGPAGADSLGTQLHWALAFQAVASGAWWAFLPPTIVLTLVSFGFLLLQASLDEVFNPRLRRGKRKQMKQTQARRLAEAQAAAAARPTTPARTGVGAGSARTADRGGRP
ncbi:ABC transporter permease [Kineococcus aurantiacus]|uniref:Peptide/nickel transport system permease protein n=1 Tax=Kineococcus aurantiacus TaxID=37633 RepID=A0A7Y9DQ68_9ACTN|nr:ABC transporter permease [Kineococcus aurantiacus]NYD24704.1 peptide/nickel transport system permease protein [Kineococcus aurantiacus]